MTIPRYKVWLPCKKATVEALLIDFENKEVMYRWKDKQRMSTFVETDAIGDVSVMQYTGIKDRNSVEIFEGDIVLLTSKSINYADTFWHSYAEVFRNKNGAYRLRGADIYETELYSNRKQVIVVGNIYKTPKLLEEVRFWTKTYYPEITHEVINYIDGSVEEV